MVVWSLHRGVNSLKLVHDLTVRVDISNKWKARSCDVSASPEGIALPAFKERDVLVECGQRRLEATRKLWGDLLALADPIMKGIKLEAQTKLAVPSDADVTSLVQYS